VSDPVPVCIGHSHVRVVADAARDEHVPLIAIDFWHTKPFDAETADRTRFRDEVARQLTGGPVFSLIGGNAHHKLGLVAHPRRFDFVLPAVPDLPLDDRAEIVPADAVRAALGAITREYLDLMRIVHETNDGNVVHLQPPPVYADEAQLKPDVPWMFFTGSRREVSPRYLRYKLWHLHSEILEEFCRASGIGFLKCPPEVADADGFLRPRYYADAMHVNQRYGSLVLHQIGQAA
jgi:hypothetical protein